MKKQKSLLSIEKLDKDSSSMQKSCSSESISRAKSGREPNLLRNIVSKVKGARVRSSSDIITSSPSIEIVLERELSNSNLSLRHESSRTSLQSWGSSEAFSKRVKIKGELKNDASFKGLSFVQNLRVESNPNDSRTSKTSTHSFQKDSADTADASGIWKMKFNNSGNLLACGRNDGDIVIWSRKLAGRNSSVRRSSFHPSLRRHNSNPDLNLQRKSQPSSRSSAAFDSRNSSVRISEVESNANSLFDQTPYRVLAGHILAITDLSWGQNGLLLSASLDFTVRLWHPDHDECLAVFQHSDCVSSVIFNPVQDNLFVSGSVDGIIRTWNITEKRMLLFKEIVGDPITAIHIPKDGNTVIAGTLSGLCIFYDFSTLRYNTQVAVTGGKFRTHTSKIIGIESQPNTPSNDEKILITSADAKVRLYQLRDKSLIRTYRGAEIKNGASRATFSQNGEYIVIGGEDKSCLIWDTTPQDSNQQYSGMLSNVIHRKLDTAKASGQEKFILTSKYVTSAILAPWLSLSSVGTTPEPTYNAGTLGFVLLVSDDQGNILVYECLQT